ncbi:FUSC family protein [Halarcobacter ebronensis]|uniref:FUSC family protein n=1 Tax=Halarcobacter ebronensis TaxID=1462615 RepID=UPI0013E94374|nr:FUSC family protein [Halarcobacter ebronensis]QKF81573.1 putative fusaric acid resistance efflux pump, inner membrane transporter [Halarcobacter ebronensis]
MTITRDDFKIATGEWINKDLPTLLYVFKSVCACLLALSLCMVFNLSMPQTAVFTVFIVMQPFSGPVFSKSFYRLIGTVIGTTMAITFIALFAQDRVAFTLFFALWAGFCAAIGFMARNFMSYGFVMSGYTIAVVTMPIIQTPERVFTFGIDRFFEVIIGLISASFISEVLFPQNLSKSLRRSENNKFNLLMETFSNMKNIFTFNAQAVNFNRDILGTDTLRVNSNFETNINKRDSVYLKRLNYEFSHISTTFLSLRNIINNSKNNEEFITSLQNIYANLEEVLKDFHEKPIDNKNIDNLLFELRRIKQLSYENIEKEKNNLKFENNFELKNDFKTICILINRLQDELYEYCNTYLGFINKDKKIKIDENFVQNIKFSTYSDNLLIMLMIVRATSAMIAMMCLWMVSGWQYAAFGVIPAIANTLLLSTAPNPQGIIKSTIIGATIGLVITPIYNFYIIPSFVTDLPTMCLALTPILAILSLMMILPGKSFIGFGILLVFITTVAVNSSYHSDFAFFFGTAMATIVGLMMSTLSFILFDFTSNSWIESRVRKVLSKQINILIKDDLALQRAKLEMLNFDLMQRYSVVGRLDTNTNSKIFTWILSTVEIGKAIINIRKKATLIEGRKPIQIRLILNYLEKMFDQKDKEDKNVYRKKIEKLMHDLENKKLKSANGQKILNDISTEIGIIYSIIKNREFLPIQGER